MNVTRHRQELSKSERPNKSKGNNRKDYILMSRLMSMAKFVRRLQYGNGVVFVHIPKAITESLGLGKGDMVEIEDYKRGIKITKIEG